MSVAMIQTMDESPSELLRLCTKCLQPKPKSEFYAKEDTADGYVKQCKPCLREKQLNWRIMHGRADYGERRMPIGRPPKNLPPLTDFNLKTDQDIKDAVAMGGMEYEEIGRRMGCSRQAAQQVVERATAKLRRHCEAQGISFNDLFQEMRRQ